MITVEKRKNVRGRITGYVASVGAIEREGATPAEAKAACEAAVLAATNLHVLYGRRYVWTREGTVLAFYYCDGWCYDQAHPEQTSWTACTVTAGRDTAEDAAFAAMLHHAVQAYGGVTNMSDDSVRAAFERGRRAGWSGCTSSEFSGPFGLVSKSHSRRVAAVMPRSDSPAFAGPAFGV